jgi:hypothetical protein
MQRDLDLHNEGWVTAIATSSRNPDMILTASQDIFATLESNHSMRLFFTKISDTSLLLLLTDLAVY